MLFSYCSFKTERYKQLALLHPQGNHDRNPIEEMRAAEAAGTFVYVPPEEDDSEFVDAPQQPSSQSTKLNINVTLSDEGNTYSSFTVFQ